MTASKFSSQSQTWLPWPQLVPHLVLIRLWEWNIALARILYQAPFIWFQSSLRPRMWPCGHSFSRRGGGKTWCWEAQRAGLFICACVFVSLLEACDKSLVKLIKDGWLFITCKNEVVVIMLVGQQECDNSKDFMRCLQAITTNLRLLCLKFCSRQRHSSVFMWSKRKR